MFPPALSRPAFRARLVRGLDLAVEFATLGEYGVEEVEVVAELPSEAASGWDWPDRCGEGRARGIQASSARPRRPL